MALAQQPGYKPVRLPAKETGKSNQRVLNPLATEICDNGIDDDGNGLADLKDFACYLNADNETCEPSSIIWGCSNWDFYWADIATGTVHHVGQLKDLLFDITWASNGKLFGMSGNGMTLYEVNPNTAELTLVTDFLNYYGGNAMTADANGNLYIAGMLDEERTGWYVVKYNIATGTITKVANLSAEYLTSGGDLTFLNGKLYLTCTDNKMAVIDVNSGKITVQYFANSEPPQTFMGLITMGDGFLYVCWGDKILRIDPVSMIVDYTAFFDFRNPDMHLMGMSSYAEICNAPICKPKLKIDTLSPTPFCSATGVQLRGNGRGISGEVFYEWTLPDKTKRIGAELQVRMSGKYYLHYSATSASCDRWDSVSIEVTPTPWIDLGEDKLICKNSAVELLAVESSGGINNYTWNDGSLSEINTVQKAGTYWVHVSNICGVARDTIIVNEMDFPEVQLEDDTAICPGSSFTVVNKKQKQGWDSYTWSNGSTHETIAVQSAGIYWLQSANLCGAIRDTILVSYVDSCTCFPLYPQASLGNDMSICNYETVTLRNESDQNGFRYNWRNGSTEKNITAKAPGIYWVDVSTYCGTVRDSVTVLEKTEDCERKVIVPSAFTPNGDGHNDIFRPIVYGMPDQYEFVIYNRWGQVVFRSKKPGEGWNGLLNGKKQDANLYVWACSYRFSGQEQHSAKGTVALLK